MKTKILAFYLPQFHQIPENDKWWGEGFTDWVSAKSAKPIFPGHYQPRIPANDNFYDLLNKSTMQWQAKLARKSGVDGFCIYHYWFGDKQILEKPAENLLKWQNIDINYCFSWANESWITSWSKLVGNAWTGSCEKNQSGNGMLLDQRYGDIDEWVAHFNYLLPFFKDKRYIKKDGKPIFVIYKPDDIPKIKELKTCWNNLALENGLSGIYFIGTNPKSQNSYKSRQFDAFLQYEPAYTNLYERYDDSLINIIGNNIRIFLNKSNIKCPRLINYDKVWTNILNRESKRNVYRGAFVDFDCSPRKGINASIYVGSSPKKFYKYFNQLYNKCSREGDDFIFVTAWNEWGEGAYLEPDRKYGLGYLNAIRKTVYGDYTDGKR
jgi:hypothetical protein